jgi:hypothetical protein
MANLPLLLKGYNTDLNGGNNTIPSITTTAQWQNVFDSGRGDVMYIDGMETGRPAFYSPDLALTVTILVSGVQVIVAANSGDFAPFTNPGNYYLTPLRQQGGQTLSVQIIGSATVAHGFQVLAFYYNEYDTPEYRSKIFTSKLKRRWQDSIYTVSAAAKFQQSSTFTVPVGNGTVVGIELLGYLQTGSATSDLPNSTVSMYVNGVSIFENVSAIYGHATCTRPQIFPIKINPGDTYYFVTDASLAGAGLSLGIGARLYFDETN